MGHSDCAVVWDPPGPHTLRLFFERERGHALRFTLSRWPVAWSVRLRFPDSIPTIPLPASCRPAGGRCKRNQPGNGRCGCVPRTRLFPGAARARVSDPRGSPLLPLAAARRPGAKPRGGGGAGKRSAWLAADGSKRWGEAFFLLYTPFWLTLCLGVVVPFKLYEVLLHLVTIVLCSQPHGSRLVVGRSMDRVLDWILDDVIGAGE